MVNGLRHQFQVVYYLVSIETTWSVVVSVKNKYYITQIYWKQIKFSVVTLYKEYKKLFWYNLKL